MRAAPPDFRYFCVIGETKIIPVIKKYIKKSCTQLSHDTHTHWLWF